MSLFDIEPEAKKKKKEDSVHRLTDMLVTDVDIVDKPANGRRFLLFKRGCGMADVSSVEITEKDGGELIAVEVSEPDVESGADSSGSGDNKKEVKTDSSEKTTEDVAKAEPGEGQGAGGERQGDGGRTECICAECGNVMTHEKGTPCTSIKCDKCGGAMVGKSETEEKAEEKTDEKTDEEAGEKTEEKKSEEGNTLPGPVKAAILSSVGEATDRLMGVQTVLRSANVSVDKVSAPLPNKIYGELKAIGELLSGVSTQYASPTTKSESGAGEFVRDILKQAGVVMHGEVRDSVMASVGAGVERLMALSTSVKAFEEVEAKAEGTMPTSITEAIKAVTDSLSDVVDKFPSPAAKSDEVLAKLEEFFDGIKTVVSEVLSSSGIIPEEKAKEPEEEEEVMEDDELAKSANSKKDVLTEMKKSIDILLADMKAKETVKATEKKELPSSNATDADAGGDKKEVEKSAPKVSWPTDMAESVNEGE